MQAPKNMTSLVAFAQCFGTFALPSHVCVVIWDDSLLPRAGRPSMTDVTA